MVFHVFHKTKTNPIHIPMAFNVFAFEFNENYTYSNDFPSFGGPGESRWNLVAAFAYLLAKTSQDPQNMEPHWNMQGVH